MDDDDGGWYGDDVSAAETDPEQNPLYIADLDLDDINIDVLLGPPVVWDFPSRLNTVPPSVWSFPKSLTPDGGHVTWDFARQLVGESVKFSFVRQTSDGSVTWLFPTQLDRRNNVAWAHIKQLQDKSTLHWNFTKQLKQTTTIEWNFPNQIETIKRLVWSFSVECPRTSTVQWNFPPQLTDSHIPWRFVKLVPASSSIPWGFARQLHVASKRPWAFTKALDENTTVSWNFSRQLRKCDSVSWHFPRQSNSSTSVPSLAEQPMLPRRPREERWKFPKNLAMESSQQWNFPSLTGEIAPVNWDFVSSLGGGNRADVPDHDVIRRENQTFKERYMRGANTTHKLATQSSALTGRSTRNITLQRQITLPPPARHYEHDLNSSSL